MALPGGDFGSVRRRVVGWKLGESLEAELVVTALRNALVLRQPDRGLYFHSDRGSQYSSQAVRHTVERYWSQAEHEWVRKLL